MWIPNGSMSRCYRTKCMSADWIIVMPTPHAVREDFAEKGSSGIGVWGHFTELHRLPNSRVDIGKVIPDRFGNFHF